MEDNYNIETNFNIADFFTSLQNFKDIVLHLRKTMIDEVDRKRLRIIIRMAKKDIEETFQQIGREN